MFSQTTELHFKNYHLFVEDSHNPSFGYRRDSEGVLYINLYKFRLSIYGRSFNRKWVRPRRIRKTSA